MPSQWLPALWGDVQPQWKTEQAFERIIGLVMHHMNGIANSLMDPEFEFEPLFMAREVEGQLYTIVNEWCAGYLRGIGLAQAQWREGEDELAEYLAPILLFADEKGVGDVEDAVGRRGDRIATGDPDGSTCHPHLLAGAARRVP